MSGRVGLSAVLIFGLAAGHASPGAAPPAAPALRAERSPDPWALYEKAVEAARHPAPSAVSARLVPIVPSTPGLRWDADGRVLMVAWTRRARPPYSACPIGRSCTLTDGDVWLTAFPQVRDVCRSLGLPPEELDLRLRQLLGLRPAGNHDAFVQMWVDPQDFFRPCADPEVTDRECTLPAVDDSPNGRCPWDDSWMCATWTRSFPASPRDGYPWTGLGYTYDWGGPDPVGQSEFVAPRGTTVVIESITATAEYCAASSQRPSTRPATAPPRTSQLALTR